jgi:hypothetical protein
LHDAKEGFCEYGDTVSGSIEARNLINSFWSLSYDGSVTSSKASSPQSAI